MQEKTKKKKAVPKQTLNSERESGDKREKIKIILQRRVSCEDEVLVAIKSKHGETQMLAFSMGTRLRCFQYKMAAFGKCKPQSIGMWKHPCCKTPAQSRR